MEASKTAASTSRRQLVEDDADHKAEIAATQVASANLKAATAAQGEAVAQKNALEGTWATYGQRESLGLPLDATD